MHIAETALLSLFIINTNNNIPGYQCIDVAIL